MTVGSHNVTVQLTVRGDIPEDDRAYAVDKIQHVLHLTGKPVLKAHLVLELAGNPAHLQRVRLAIEIDLNGMPIRAHIAADTVREGADLLEARLGRRLVETQDRARARQRVPSTSPHA